VRREKAELEEQRDELAVRTAAARRRTQELEDDILRILATATDQVPPPRLRVRVEIGLGTPSAPPPLDGSSVPSPRRDQPPPPIPPHTTPTAAPSPQGLLEDAGLVTTLKTSKQTSLDIQRQLRDAEVRGRVGGGEGLSLEG